MKSTVLAVSWWLLVSAGLSAAGIIFSPDTEDGDTYRLPEGFLVGAGGSAYQTEGAWNVSGKKESVLDHYYNPDNVPESEKISHIAADSYHHIDDDIEMIKRLKLQVYRFSIAWSRLLPDGDPTKPNADGIRYYNEIIDKLLKINVVPFINLYHFDHPLTIQEKYFGWVTDGIIDAFVDFADFAFKTFGDRVKYWTTLNEPNMYCLLGGSGLLGNVPKLNRTSTEAFYACMRVQLLAHAKTYHLYKEKYAATQGGMVGMTFATDVYRPQSTKYEDVEAAERGNAYGIGVCVSPIIYGDFPQSVIEYAEKKYKAMNQKSPIPSFTEAEKNLLKRSTDFLGMNIYNGKTAAGGIDTSKPDPNDPYAEMYKVYRDADFKLVANPSYNGKSPFGDAFKQSTPWAMHDALLYTWNNYDHTPIFITENGLEDTEVEGIHDQNRAAYYSAYARTMLETMKEHKVNVLGLVAWALIDGLEWSKTTHAKFGLVHVDYSTPERTRTLKDSSAFFIKLAEERKVPLVPWIDNAAASGSRAPHPSPALWLGSLVITSALVIIRPPNAY